MKSYRKIATRAVLGAALAAGLTGYAEARTVKIGVVLPFSGVNADQGETSVRAMDLYLKLHGKDLGSDKIELIKRDSGPPTGASAKTAVTELVVRDHVSMVIGFEFSPDAIASIPVITQAKIPMIISNAGTAWITNLSPYVTRTSFTMWQAAYPMGQYAAKTLKCETAAIGYSDYPPGKDSLEAFKRGFEGAGGKVVDEIPMGNPAQVPDFTPFIRRVKDEKPQCFYVFVPGGAHSTAVMNTAVELGLAQAGVRLIGPLDIIPDDRLQAMGDQVIGLTVMGHYSVDYDNPANKEFVAAWKKEYGSAPDTVPNFLSAGAWNAMAAAMHAVETVKGDLTGDAIMASLKGWSFDAPQGKITLDPATRDIIQDEHVEQVVKLPDGRLAVKVIDTIPAVKDPCKELKAGQCGQ